MSNTNALIAVAVSWLGSAGAGVTAFVKQARKYEAEAVKLATQVEDQISTILNEVQAISDKVGALTPPAKPTAAKKAAPKA